MVTAFRYFQIGVVARRELDALWGNEVCKRVVCSARRRRGVDRTHHLLVLLRASDSQHAWMRCAYDGLVHTHTACDDHATIFGNRLANGLKRFGFCAIDKAAGVDYDDVRVVVVRNNLVALGAQLCEDAFRIYECLGTAKANKTDFWG